ncbi:DUF3325 domain-containing protein [Undibacterium sp. Tian12W]|uniref:DUF3325 domain-containing protein n=1 Tax=Undibacterium sp. Tian12W TaxID=3413054 RepID=UPI003BF1EF4A
MPDTLFLIVALAASVAGMGWLALAMEVHWEQVRGTLPQTPQLVTRLRCLGAAGLFASLLLCLKVDHASMAALVWIMAVAFAAISTAFTLTWRPHWLRVLVFWV